MFMEDIISPIFFFFISFSFTLKYIIELTNKTYLLNDWYKIVGRLMRLNTTIQKP